MLWFISHCDRGLHCCVADTLVCHVACACARQLVSVALCTVYDCWLWRESQVIHTCTIRHKNAAFLHSHSGKRWWIGLVLFSVAVARFST